MYTHIVWSYSVFEMCACVRVYLFVCVGAYMLGILSITTTYTGELNWTPEPLRLSNNVILHESVGI